MMTMEQIAQILQAQNDDADVAGGTRSAPWADAGSRAVAEAMAEGEPAKSPPVGEQGHGVAET